MKLDESNVSDDAEMHEESVSSMAAQISSDLHACLQTLSVAYSSATDGKCKTYKA
jgi:hypothetical protein